MTRVNYRALVISLYVFAATVAISASAQTYTELLNFNGTSAAGPQTALTQGIDGNLYGTTIYGGTGACTNGGIGCGIVFKIARDRKLQILYNFQLGGPINPSNTLLLGRDGNLYGTTGGAIFKITPSGDFTVLYTFKGGTDGADPQGFIQGADGNFYGTTPDGGAHSNSCPEGCGTVFKITPAGVHTTLYSFCPQNYCPDGENPKGALVQGPDGSFYGTTTYGGVYKEGTIFKITPKGEFTLLYTFDKDVPSGGLILGSDGNFYGASTYVLFQITPQGVYTELVASTGLGLNTPVQGTDGNLYWTTDGLGSGRGALYEMPPDGQTASLLHSFVGYPSDGSDATTSPVQATDGKFYGTTFTGGPYPCNYSFPGCGTIFSLDMGLSPFVAFVNRSGKVGQKVGILGENFAGTSGVSINGTPASFTVKSSTLLITTVPAGATTGYLTVTTLNGTLTSNVAFYVIP